jgi:hypothetical protein
VEDWARPVFFVDIEFEGVVCGQCRVEERGVEVLSSSGSIIDIYLHIIIVVVVVTFGFRHQSALVKRRCAGITWRMMMMIMMGVGYIYIYITSTTLVSPP